MTLTTTMMIARVKMKERAHRSDSHMYKLIVSSSKICALIHQMRRT